MLRSLPPSLVFVAALAAGCLGDVAPSHEPRGDNGGGGSGAAGGGGGGNNEDGGTPPGDLAMGPPSSTGTLAVSLAMSADSVRLNETRSYDVTLTPGNGFNGAVMLAATGLGDKMTATFTPAQLMVGTSPAKVKLAIHVASDAKASAGASPITVKATSAAISGEGQIAIQVPAELLIEIPAGVQIGTKAAPNTKAFGGVDSVAVYQVMAGTKVTWVNRDAITHRIHSNGDLGIEHQGAEGLMANGANSYTQTFKAAGTFNYFCHIHPNMLGKIIVMQ